MVVVPRAVLANANINVAREFFRGTFGKLVNGDRVFHTFSSISSLGNVIIMTFTAARMKQEIAKEGFLPFARFFAQDYDLSLGRLLKWLRGRGMFTSILRHKWLSPEAHQEKTPVGAFVLHFASCIVLILSTKQSYPDDAYNILTSAWVYLFPAFFGFLLAVGILILRFKGPKGAPLDRTAIPGTHARKQTWTEMTDRAVNPAVSVFCAVVYALGCLYPVIVSWIPPKDSLEDKNWFVIPTIACGVLAFAALWFLGFLGYAKRREKRRHEKFVIERHPQFELADGYEDGLHGAGGEEDESDVRRRAVGLVLVHETVSLLWKAKEALDLEILMTEGNGNGGAGMNGGNGVNGAGGEPGRPVNPYAGTDFEEMGR